ncbi:hypothetical protein BLNAU_24934 [Blattamonas nauphoetae]|uniref:Uncharacterized protein n=1 Tax=Blattamonas nauphoetae TaxID=2049346 RepID=A0ABQ9WL22_9EUKA|nr:hypothetical protein BLNAU_24934 [Blattamonas nauphoetae]
MYEAPPGYVEPKTADDEEEKEEETAGIGAAFPQAIAGKNARWKKMGHQTGDRECPLRFINPRDALRKEMEDPMTFMMQKESEMKTEITKQNELTHRGNLQTL